jgi:H+/Cl- antiporter ClcA
MQENPSFWPKLLVGAGLALVVAGMLAWLLQGKLNWLGRLPGDIRVEKEHFRFYFPLTTMLLLSLLLNLILWAVRRLWG